MALKLVLVSPVGTLVDEDKRLVKGHVDEMCKFISLMAQNGVHVAIWSNKKWTVDGQMGLDEYFTKHSGVLVEAVGAGISNLYPARRMGDSVQPILKKYNVSRFETLLVGNGEEDLLAGVNNKLLLLRPSWYDTESEYGLPVESVSDLAKFCCIFGLRQHPIYWRINYGGLYFSAMGPYSTRIQRYADFGSDAFQSAKFDKGTLDFWHRLVASTLYFSGLIDGVNYISAYPGHGAQRKSKSIDEVMTLLGKCFRINFYPDLIVRHKDAVKSAYAAPHLKTFKNQIDSIRLNRRPLKYGVKANKTDISLRGKRVLIVDDICTNGRSLESARQYIEAAGGSAILFSWLKTINTDFIQVSDRLNLRPFEVNTLATEPAAIAHAYRSNVIDEGAASEIAELLERYIGWAF